VSIKYVLPPIPSPKEEGRSLNRSGKNKGGI